MDEENIELFKVKVFKVKEVNGKKQQFNKMVLRFTEEGDLHPELQIGAGSNALNVNSKADKFFMFKGSTYMNLIYYDQDEKITGIQMNQHKVVARSATPHSNGGGHISNVWYGTSDPDSGIGYNGDIYIKLKESKG